MAVWLVRAGKYGEREQTALEKSVLVIGWNEFPDLSAVQSKEALADLYRKLRPDASSGKVSNHVGQLWLFRSRIQPGDLAILPLKTHSAIAIGKVTGPYQYTTDLGDGVRHIRKVEWLRTDLPRTAFGQDILYSLGAFMTVCQIERDPNLLYDLQTKLADYHIYTASEIDAFAAVWFDPRATQDKLHGLLASAVDRYEAAGDEDNQQFRSLLGDFVRLYAFLSQVVTFTDSDLEKLYVYGRMLLRKLPVKRDQLPVEIQQNIDVDSYRVQQTSSGKIRLDRGTKELEPITGGNIFQPLPEEMEALSQILKTLNDRFGTDFTDDDKVFIQQLEEKLSGDRALEASVKVNVPENARLTFDHVANDKIQEMIDSNFKFYKQINDDKEFEQFFLGWLFERYKRREKEAG
jgi:hypothetical protein